MRLVDESFEPASKRDPAVALYRDRTVGMLQKYLRMSTELGQLPSLIGREFFRSHVSHYRTHTFEDTFIFVHDMDRSLDLLSRRDQVIVATLFLQQYTLAEAAKRLAVGVATVFRWRLEALDALSSILLARKLLRPMLPIENLDLQDHSENDESLLPPKKGCSSVKVLHAVAVSA